MALRLYNTMTRTKEDFVPIDPANVRLYVCGPTVYDFAHIGNARPMIVFDVLFRLLRHLYGPDHVTYVRNITDVDDKINARAVRDFPGMKPVEAIRHLTEITDRQFQADVTALNCLPPTVQPRATEHVTEMLAIMERLVAGGYAYAADGHVLFHVPADGDYGRLSRRSLEDMVAGARVDVAPYKRDPMDFVLWKPSSEDEPGWPSPWGRGRPGWHLECSAMSWKHLGETFDIHGGGIDLVFPHHENEIAQSCSAFGTPVMANVWMHNGFLQVEGEKMSKSLGNFLTIRELLDDWPGEVLRFAMLRSHYRQPIDFTISSLEHTQRELRDWTKLIADSHAHRAADDTTRINRDVIVSLMDDLNTPEMLASVRRLFALASKGHRDASAELATTLRFLGVSRPEQFGKYSNAIAAYVGSKSDVFEINYRKILVAKNRIANQSPFLASSTAELDAEGICLTLDEYGRPMISFSDVDTSLDKYVEQQISARLAARKGKNFAESDRIRDELAAMGVVLKDGKDPATGEPVTTWEVKR